jgi:hypothetical protein
MRIRYFEQTDAHSLKRTVATDGFGTRSGRPGPSEAAINPKVSMPSRTRERIAGFVEMKLLPILRQPPFFDAPAHRRSDRNALESLIVSSLFRYPLPNCSHLRCQAVQDASFAQPPPNARHPPCQRSRRRSVLR